MRLKEPILTHIAAHVRQHSVRAEFPLFALRALAVGGGGASSGFILADFACRGALGCRGVVSEAV